MTGPLDVVANEFGGHQIADMQWFPVPSERRKIEHLIEIAIVEKSAPVDGNQVSTHDPIEILFTMRPAQQAHIAIKLALRYQDRPEALNWHVGERVEMIELDPVLLAENAFVIGFKLGLSGRQRSPLRI